MTFLESDIILHLRLNLTTKNDVLFINTFRKDFWDVLKDSGSNGKKYDIIGTWNNKIIKSKRTIFKDIGCCLLVRLAFVWDCIKHFINIFSNWTAYQLFMCKHLLTSVNIPQITQISDIWNSRKLNLDQRNSFARDYDIWCSQIDHSRNSHSQMFFKIAQYSEENGCVVASFK